MAGNKTCQKLLQSAMDLVNKKSYQAGLQILNQYIKLEPSDAKAYHLMGMTLAELRLIPQSIGALKKTIALSPHFAEAYSNLGCVMANVTGSEEEARGYLEKAVKLEANNPNFLSNLARIYHLLGREDDAVVICHKVIGQHPEFIPIYFLMPSSIQWHDETIARVEAILAGDSISSDNRIKLGFTLAGVYNKRKNYKAAFTHVSIANSLKSEAIALIPQASYQPKAVEQAIKTMKRCFRPEVQDQIQGYGCDSNLPIFIIGMPRSGTTLTEQILASHPQVCGAGELEYMGQITTEIIKTMGQQQSNISNCILQLSSNDARSLGEQYVKRLQIFDMKATRITDKMPVNFMFMGTSKLILPRARYIHCRRDPRDILVSCYFQNFFSPAQSFSYDPNNFIHYYNSYNEIMDYWREVLNIEILDVSYEDLVENQEEVSRRIIDFCGLEWNDASLDFHKQQRTVTTASTDQVRQPMYKGSMARWKHYEPWLSEYFQQLVPCSS